MSSHVGSWSVHTVDGASVRLRSGRIGLMSVEVSAPVTGGRLQVAGDGVRLTLNLALDRLSTNFLLQSAARSLVKKNDAHDLGYQGAGPASDSPWQVSGVAVAGDVNVELVLVVTPAGPAEDAMAAIELVGSANLGTVHLPLPGLGTVEDFSFDVDARLALRAR